MASFHVAAARLLLLAVSDGFRLGWRMRTLARPLTFVAFMLLTAPALAQFTGNIQGTVEDPSGAAIAQAKVALINAATQVSATTTTDASGGYRFLSLAPGSYKITVEADGFAKAEVTVSLDTR